MTKEEILNGNVGLYFSSHHDKSRWNGEGEHGGAEWHTDKALAVDIYKAMDEYAKQQALAFANYVMNDYKTSLHPESPILTDEQIYEQFIKKQQP